MRLALRFWKKTVVWTGILLVIFAVPWLLGGGFANVIAHLPAWGGLALVLSTFPAGIGVYREVLVQETVPLRPVVSVTLAAVAVSVLVLVLAGFAGPAVMRGLGEGESLDPNRMSIAELSVRAKAALRMADEGAPVPASAESSNAWLEVNILVWHYYRRLAGVVQPILFTWLGVLTGFWARWSPRRDVALVQYWLMGVFLVMSTYLAGENSLELIVLQATGPVFFAGLFVLIVPTLLLLGMSFPTAVTVWQRHKRDITD